MSSRIKGPFIFISGLILTSTVGFGQAGRAELSGAIHDPSALPVPNAKVEAENQATMARYAVISDERGEDADLMIGKTFRITERVNLEFRAEAFDVSSTPPLNDLNGNFGSAAFGSITSAGNPRDFEFVGKVHF
jgi:hypothetical protein